MRARSKVKPVSKLSHPLPPLPDALALKRKIKVKQAAALLDMHEDSFRKHFGHTIIRLAPRHDVVELGVVLALGQQN
jgi:hypothetical protein